MLRLYTFGGLRIERDGHPIQLPSQKARDVLAYLILHRDRSLPRDLLTGIFWPDRPDRRARRALSQALWQIRSALGTAASRLVVEQDTVGFLLHPDDQLDVASFEEKVRATSISGLSEAATLYGADFLEGYYDDWVLLERERLRGLYLATLERLIVFCKQRGEYEQALANAQRLAAADPLRESAHQELMRLYHLLGRDRAALEQYEALRRFLAGEVGAEPMAATVALAREIAAQLEEIEPPHLPVKPRPAPVFEQPELMPLVGREEERATLLTHLEAAVGGRGALVLVEGEAGVGKTRLLQEMARDAEWRGVQACWGRGWELAEQPAYGVLREALGAALSPLRAGQLTEVVDRARLRDATSVLPELAAGLPDLPAPVSLGTERQRRRLLEALAQIALALGRVAPHLLILDDLQWADEASLVALAHLVPRLKGSCVLAICSYRGEEARERPAIWEGLQALDRVGGHQRLLLARLTAGQTGELVQRALGLATSVPHFEKRLYQETDGNPLFVLETLRALRDEGLLHRDEIGEWRSPWDEATGEDASLPLPTEISQAINRRLALLEADERAVLNVAAVLGNDFDFALLTHAGSLSRKAALEAASELIRRRFLVEGPAAYHFSHDKMRQAVYETIEVMERRRLHRQAGLALEGLHPRQVEQLAHHFSLGQVWEKAVEYNCRAGERARAVYAGAEALGHYARALEAWHHLQPPDEHLGLELYRERGTICQETGRFDQAEADFQAAVALAEQAADQAAQARTFNHLSYLRFQRGDFEGTVTVAQQALELATEAELPSEVATALFNQANAMRNQGDYQTAIRFYRQAVPLFEELDEQVRLADSLNRMGAALYHTGDYASGQTAMERSLAIRRQLDDRVGISYSLINLSTLYYHQGQYARAREVAQEAAEISSAIQDPYGEDAALNNLGMAILEQGDPARAIPLIQRALEIGREIGDQAMEPDALAQLGRAYHLLGDPKRGREALEQALNAASISIARYQIPLIRALLALLLLEASQGEEALAHARAGLQVAQEIGEPWSLGLAHRAMGKAYAHQGSDEATTHFEESIRILREIDAEAELARGLAAYGLHVRHSADTEKAQYGVTLLDEARALFRRLEMTWDLAQLEAETLSDLPPGQVRVRLPATSAPTGRPLREDETIAVTWTVAAPEDECISKKVPRRRHRLLRLLREAADQSVAPTVPDLAEALGVGARTVERDLAALRAAGHEVRTRGTP